MSETDSIDDIFLNQQFKAYTATTVGQWKDLMFTAACITVSEQGIKSKAELASASKDAYAGYVRNFCDIYRDEMPPALFETGALQRISFKISAQTPAREVSGDHIWRKWNDGIKRTIVNQYSVVFNRSVSF